MRPAAQALLRWLRPVARRFGLTRSQLLAESLSRSASSRLALNRLCGPDAWEDPEWLMTTRALCLYQGDNRVHRKAFEWAHCVYGLEHLGMLGPSARVLGVGAGHEHVLYYLANRSAITVATDLYGIGAFADSLAQEAAADFLTDPGRYAPFPYRAAALRAVVADGRALPFADSSFDVVYSLSSIEHFGGHEAAATAMGEMARVLRPGGVVCVATEFILAGQGNGEYFSRAELEEFIIRRSGLVLVGALDDTPPPSELLDDPIRIAEPQEVYRTPHVVLAQGDLKWTSVILFLRKPRRMEFLRLGASTLRRRFLVRGAS